MRILGFTIIKTAALNDLRELICKLQADLTEARKNDYKDPKTKKYIKAPKKKANCKK